MEKIFLKIEEKVDLKKVIKSIFIIFMIFQPILDIYMCLFDSKIQIVGVSLATILRFGIVFIMALLTMVYTRKNKSTKFFIGYLVLVLIYMVFHHINAINFTVPLAEAQYNVLSEIMYIARMCIPVTMVYIIYCIKPNYKDVKKIVVSVSLIISTVIIVSNLFNVSYMSYSLENNKIAHNMFFWFSNERDSYYWVNLTSRGFFQSGNQLSGVLVILMPILVYIALKENKFKYWFFVLLHLIAMLNLTTRVGVLGGIIMLIAVSAIKLLEEIIHKQISFKILKKKNIYCIFIICVIYIILLYNSPFIMRIKSGELSNDMPVLETSENVQTSAPNYDEKALYVISNYKKANIHEYFVFQAYPVTDDSDFWYDVITKVPASKRVGNRNIKKLLMKRVLERDNRISNYIVGISFSRASSFVWPERDFETQLDSMGIIGEILFVLPYVIILLMGIWNFFKNFKENLYLNKVVYLIALAVGLFAGYVSGHILNEIFPFMFLSMMCGIILNSFFGMNLENADNDDGLKKYFKKIFKKGKEEFYNDLEKNILNEKKEFIITANPETIMVSEKDKDLKKAFFDESTVVIPDGVGILKGAKMFNLDMKETILGVDVTYKLFELGGKYNKKIFLFGAKREVLDKLTEVIEKKYPGIQIVGAVDGYVDNKEKIFDDISQLKPDIVLVALGIPIQEKLIYENMSKFDKGIFVGVGGSFDVISGVKKRAPIFFRKTQLEWLYRITTEPKRLGRFFKSNVKYLFKIYNEK